MQMALEVVQILSTLLVASWLAAWLYRRWQMPKPPFEQFKDTRRKKFRCKHCGHPKSSHFGGGGCAECPDERTCMRYEKGETFDLKHWAE